VSHPWLKPFAAGAAIVAVASTGAWAFAAFRQKPDLLVITYAKPTGLHPDPQPVDPAPKFENASAYLVAYARKCRLQSWQLEYNGMPSDADDVASLKTDLRRLPDANFNCLVRIANSPLITVERKSI
jgi:hypothetical protein